MNNKFSTGVITGSILGAVVGTAIISSMDRKKRRRVLKTSKSLMSSASSMFGDMNMFKR